MNRILSGDNELPYADYSDLLDKILWVLQNGSLNLFSRSADGNRLIVDFDEVAAEVVKLRPVDVLGSSANSVRTTTVNFSPAFEEEFPRKIKAIKNQVKVLLQRFVSKVNAEISLEDLAATLVTDLQQLKTVNANLDFCFPFPGGSLRKQRLTIQDKTANRQSLKFHKLTVTVRNSQNFNEELRRGIEKYIQERFAGANEADKEDLQDILGELEKSPDFEKLKGIFDRETLGKLKRQGQILYLQFLRDNVHTGSSNPNLQGVVWLDVLIRRLQRIDEYINDLSKGDGDYLVSYGGVELNYRDVFSQGDAFDRLPVIPKIEGYLGETKDESQGELKFILGLKLKFDGQVQAHGEEKGKNVFDYNLMLINPESDQHKAEFEDPQRRPILVRKVLKIVFLYYFVFAGNNPNLEGYTPESNLNYDVVGNFETKVLPILKGSSDDNKRRLFGNIITGFTKYGVRENLSQLKIFMKGLLQRKTPFPLKEESVHIAVSREILEENIEQIFDRDTFFKPVLRGNPKQVLRYLSVGKASLTGNPLLSLRGSLSISEVHYYSTNDSQSFNMEYDLEGIKVLPILFLARDERSWEVYNNYFKSRKLIAFPYSLERENLEPAQIFVYRFTFALLVYMFLKILLEKQSRLFIPILRLQVSNREENVPIEKFILDFSMVLAHLLNQEYRANAQGIDIRNVRKSDFKFKVQNSMSSLYSLLPRKFSFAEGIRVPELNNLAIVIVSSRESDSSWRSKQKISNLMGEMILARRQKDGSVKVQQFGTFSQNCEHEEMFREPRVIIDNIHKLYKMGCKHFLYIAKAPYSSTLHLTREENDDGLFFMSKEVISHLKAEYSDIRIYPIFFDKYYAVKLEKKAIKAESLYIQETEELTALLEDRSQQCVVFFNLFNGLQVGDDRNYNGVISYATLLNFYENVMPTANIYGGLIDDTPLKQDILQYLSLFHFWRYEAVGRKDKPISFKLDPYENLIGDYSVGKLSLQDHSTGKGQFNFLAFLTEVKRFLVD